MTEIQGARKFNGLVKGWFDGLHASRRTESAGDLRRLTARGARATRPQVVLVQAALQRIPDTYLRELLNEHAGLVLTKAFGKEFRYAFDSPARPQACSAAGEFFSLLRQALSEG